jgi:hypothetical protein
MADHTANENVPEADGQGERELSLREELAAQFDAAQGAVDGEAAAPAAPAGERERDPSTGRFLAKPAAEGARTAQEAAAPSGQGQPPAQAAATPPGAPTPPAAPPTSTEPLKAPASWRPEVREKWAAVAPEVQAEVHRREREFQQVLQHAASARQLSDAFERTVAPYQLLIAAEQSDPLRAVSSLLQHAAVLKTGNAAQKVQLVANLIHQHDVDLQMLDQFLAHNQMPAQQTQQQFRDPRLDMLLAQKEQYEQQQRVATEREFEQGIEWFAQQAGHEFFADVRSTMADLIEMHGRRGEVLPMEEAYKRACAMDAGVSKILADRAAAANNGRLSQAALRAKRAASSVKSDSTPHGGATVPKDDSVRAALEAAFEEHGGR